MASLRQQVGQLVRHHRVRCGLTQAELAERTKRSLEMINRIERGVTAPGFDTLQALSVALETPVREFFGAGNYVANAGHDDPLVRLINRVAGLDAEDLDWADKLIATALNRKVRHTAKVV